MLSQRSKHRLRAFAWVAALLALVVLAVRAFVGDVYYVDSRSMEPTLHGAERGGDWVFVRYHMAPAPERFDLAVIARAGDAEPLVKRIAGLPGERVQISDGDLVIDGELLDERQPRPPLVELFDSVHDDFKEQFSLTADAWSESAGVWRLDARNVRDALASWRPRLIDSYLAPDRTRVEGQMLTGDAALEIETRVPADWRKLVLRLTELGDVFELELTPEGGGALARFVRRTNGEKSEVMAELSLALRAGEWHSLRWSNVDNALALDFDGRRVAAVRYTANVPMSTRLDTGSKHVGPRVAFGGGECELEFRRVRIARDLHYSQLGQYATARIVTLGPDEVFVLGDNSSESVDSREWGPVEVRELIGTPIWVVWPPSRWRRLAPRQEIPPH